MLKEDKNWAYKSTWTNRESTSLAVVENRDILETLSQYLSDQYYYSNRYAQYLPMIREIVSLYGTPIQEEVFVLWMTENLNFTEIAEELHISKQAVHEVIYGHSTHGGGLIRKIKKHLRRKNYLT